MKTLRNRWLIAIVAILSLTAASSCIDPDDDPYYSPLVGEWESADGYSSFSFYANGTGIYIDSYNRRYNIDWSTSYDILRIRFWETSDYWTYDYYFERGCLILNDGYRSIRFYRLR